MATDVYIDPREIEGPEPQLGPSSHEFDESLVDGAQITDTDDGGVVVDLDPLPPAGTDTTEFDANLAGALTPSQRDGIAAEIIEAVEDDRRSRESWEEQLQRGIDLLGIKIEDRTYPFSGASGVYDPLMMKAVLRWQAVARGELLPAAGPVKTTLAGMATDYSEDQSKRVGDWMNLYLTELAPEYYPDFDQMLFWLPLVGSTFKKVYQDPQFARPVAPFISPINFIVSYTTTSLMTTPRATHETFLTRRELRMAQLDGQFLDIKLSPPDESSQSTSINQEIQSATGRQPVVHEGDDRYQIYNTQADYDLAHIVKNIERDVPEGLPLPYKFVIDKQSGRMLSITRNWREDDPRFTKRNNIVHYKFLPGLGFYGFGFAHTLGNTAKANTALRRQLIDAGTLNIFPGGLRVKGMKFDDNNLGIGPTEFREVDTGGLPIQQAIMTMPYKEPSVVLLEFLKYSDQGGDDLANTAEIAVGEGRQDAPVGTTVALMEAALRIQSGTIKRSHQGMREEFKLFAELFGEYLPEEPYPFPVPGGESAIMRADFTENIDVIPVSDPNITSSAQRMMRAEALKRSAMEAPQIHNMYEAFKQVYEEMGVDPMKIQRLLPPPQSAQPFDPLTENQNALKQIALAVGPEQDDEAHIKSHQPLAELPTMQAHIAEHMGSLMRKKVQMKIGMALPPYGTQLPPEIENEIAVLVAKGIEAMKAEEEGVNPSEGQIAMEALRIEAAKLLQRADEAKGRVAVDAYKARLQYQTAQKDRLARMQETMIKTRAQVTASKNRSASKPRYQPNR